jgi:hypothetical protein
MGNSEPRSGWQDALFTVPGIAVEARSFGNIKP